jgi:hypothetical protein
MFLVKLHVNYLAKTARHAKLHAKPVAIIARFALAAKKAKHALLDTTNAKAAKHANHATAVKQHAKSAATIARLVVKLYATTAKFALAAKKVSPVHQDTTSAKAAKHANHHTPKLKR